MASPKSKNISNKVSSANFYNLLENCRIRTKEGGPKITHTSWGQIMGKYHIPENKLELFLKGRKELITKAGSIIWLCLSYINISNKEEADEI